MHQFRVVDCRLGSIRPEVVLEAATAEAAAHQALGEELVRGGHSRELRARVYFQLDGQALTLVRLYAKSIHDRPRHTRQSVIP